MKDLNDKDFDQAFKQRITESFPEFEEESWLKMEQKLRRRERFVFYRNASIVLLLLSFGLSFYFFAQKDRTQPANPIVKSKIQKAIEPSPVVATPDVLTKQDPTGAPLIEHYTLTKAITNHKVKDPTAIIPTTNIDSATHKSTANTAPISNTQVAVISPTPNEQTIDKPISTTLLPDAVQPVEKQLKKSKRGFKIPISLAINAGPDFNSTETLLGGKTSVSMGISIGVGLTKKLSVQTGLAYAAKNYNAKGYNYSFNNPNVQAIIESIQAACKVLEIPLRASYNVSENQKRSIELNGGLSSYLMLKENYVYKYTAASGRKDRTNEFTNANQHFLSVLDLSATYNIKLKNTKMAVGIEPYVKIPLSGVGEGSVPLKSSGVSFKLRYDFNKKQ